MSGRVLQNLLASGEYDEFDDVVTVEGEFVETDHHHTATRQVILGITAQTLLVTQRHIVNYKRHPEVFYQTDLDPYLDGLELSTVWPLCVVRLALSSRQYELKLSVQGRKRSLYYLLTNTHTNGNLEDTWARWQERVAYLREDPYGFIKSMCYEYRLPVPYEKHIKDKYLPIVTDIFGSDSSSRKKDRKKKRRREKNIL